MVSSACVVLMILVVTVPLAMRYTSCDIALIMDVKNIPLTSNYTLSEFNLILRYISFVQTYIVMYDQNFNLGFKDQDNLSRTFSYSIGNIHITGTGKQLLYYTAWVD